MRAATKVRITKIVCPRCEGTNAYDISFRVTGETFPCPVCMGERRVSAALARFYADHLYTCAVGGYVTGDHDVKEKDRLTQKAMDIFRLLQEVPPWLGKAA